MKSKPNSKCPHHTIGVITCKVTSICAPPGPTDVEVGFPPTIAEPACQPVVQEHPQGLSFKDLLLLWCAQFPAALTLKRNRHQHHPEGHLLSRTLC